MPGIAWKAFILSISSVILVSIAAAQQYPVITAEQVQEYLGGNGVAVVDVRSFEEYREGHIPGAQNIPAERISAERTRLPRNKTAPIIFYCRGIG